MSKERYVVVPRDLDKVVIKIRFEKANRNQYLDLNSLRIKYRDELHILIDDNLDNDEYGHDMMPVEFPLDVTLVVKAFDNILEPTPNVPINELLEDLQDIRADKFDDKPTIRNGKNWLNE